MEKIKNNILKYFHEMGLSKKFTVVIVALILTPIAVFTIMLFYSMENSAKKENGQILDFYLNKSEAEVEKNIENINISMDYFLSDRKLLNYLYSVYDDNSLNKNDREEFNESILNNINRIIASNPSIEGIKIYIDRDKVNADAPIIYSLEELDSSIYNRSDKGTLEEISDGWYFKKDENSSSNFTNLTEKDTANYVRVIMDGEGKSLAVIEMRVYINKLFPKLYDLENDNIFLTYVDSYKDVYSVSASFKDFESLKALYNLYYDKINIKRSFESEYSTIKKQFYIVEGRCIEPMGGMLVGVYDMTDGIILLHENRNGYILVIVLISILLIMLTNRIVKGMFSEFYKIMDSLSAIQAGNLNTKIETKGKNEMGELGLQINKMMDTMKHLMEDNVTRERLAKNSEIRALQNQINAHFIYNVLESIKMMAEIDEKYDISDAITALGKLLRYSMYWKSGNVTVNEELDYIKNYLALINLRFDYEIYLSLNIPDIVLHQEIPKMSLQPIVENSIYHGIEQLAEDTNIYVKGSIEDGKVIIEVTDQGKGMTEQQVDDIIKKINGQVDSDEITENIKSNGNGIGLKNVQDRIHMNFGNEYGLSINSKLGIYTKVALTVPQTYFESSRVQKTDN